MAAGTGQPDGVPDGINLYALTGKYRHARQSLIAFR
jgi:hypothetical protein